ncbi:MAG: fasciclin domain-containing protein [Pleurocapsa minor GSE-CHR-MK-17-07R]|jgi:uncharacterized surface protein with fasciclin (FAS1) repeats|nr:fasciclin domain-containing protein [Pleurocapsa minor GSE-CHR-MK 17-07R]
MRKILMGLSAAALMVTALAGPIAAQETVDTSTMTIAEIVTSMSSAETPEFTALMGAIGIADPAVAAALADPDSQLTVFAPTDAAFAALAEAMGADVVAALLADSELVTRILQYHVVSFPLTSEVIVDSVTGLVDQGAPAGLTYSRPTLQGGYLDFYATETGVRVDKANIVLESSDIPASNGVIHVIDAVLLPELRTIGEIVSASATSETPQFTVLLAALDALGLTETVLDPEANITVFAPTDAAFAAAFEALGVTAEDVLADTELLASIVTFHVVPGTVHSFDLGLALFLPADPAVELPAWNGGVDASAATPTLLLNTANGAQLSFLLGETRFPMINNANIIGNDLDAANGVIHVIDAVLLPPLE